MAFIHNITRYILILSLVSLAGCVMPKRTIDNLNQLGPDEVLMVGKLSLSPAINKDEVIYENVVVLGGSKDDLHKALYLKVSDTFYTLEGGHATDMADSMVTLNGEYFYFPWKRNQPLYILGTSFITRWTSTNRDFMTFSINKGLKVQHSGKSQAIYVGNITFERDEFFNIKNIDINQKDPKKAQQAFQKKYNSQWKLEKANLASAR